MGRLFWKFFLFIWLAQMIGIIGVGTYFWFERNQASHFAGEPPFDTPPATKGVRHRPRHASTTHRRPIAPCTARPPAIGATAACRWRRC